MAANDQITRVKYFDGEFLRAVDFDAEQSYERDARRRHLLSHHTFGIVVGMELIEVPIEGQTEAVDVVLTPGMVIDGFGRELVSYHAIRLDPGGFAAFTTSALQSVWLSYQEDDSGALSSNWSDCQDSEATRTTEGWTIVVSPTPPTNDDIIVDGSPAVPAPAPSTTPASTPIIPADESVPYQELPESSPGDRWLIRLGSVHWDGTRQQFTTAGDNLANGRSYIGAVAGELYAPNGTLDILQRTAPADLDAADFVTIEGRLEVQGRIKAEKDVWIDGGMIHFAFPGGSEQNTPITLGREVPADDGSGSELRLRLGDKPDPSTLLSIGPGDASDATTPTDIVRVSGDDVVAIPDGTLTFDHTTRQMIDLYATGTDHQYGVGVQSDTASSGGTPAAPTALYQRSGSSFRWFKGGKHDDTGASDGAGAGGQLQLELDVNGSLQFGARVRQMLNLWNTNYGIGVQDSTLYFRSDSDFCWYRGGSHADGQDDPGGGTRAMRLDSGSNLHLAGDLQFAGGLGQWLDLWSTNYGIGVQDSTLYFRSDSDFCWYRGGSHADGQDDPGGGTRAMRLDSGSSLHLAGDLVVLGQAPSVVKVECYQFAKQNAGPDEAVTWTQPVSGDFTEVFQAFVVLNGFSIWANTSLDFSNFNHNTDVNSIPQHAYVRVTSFSSTEVALEAFCQESLESNDSDNSILCTLVVIGRQTP